MAVTKVDAWEDRSGTQHATQAEAEKADALLEVKEIIGNAVDFRFEEIDYDQIIAQARELGNAFATINL